MNNKRVLDDFTKNAGLLQKIFGSESVILYDSDIEFKKQQLQNVYGFTDVDQVFPGRLDGDKLRSILDIICRVPTINAQEDEEGNKKIFGLL